MLRTLLPVALALLVSVALLAVGCAGTGDALPEDEEALPPPEDVVSGIGTVRYVELEGGFYGLVANDSTRYQPQNLESTYQEDGLRVRFRAVTQDTTATVQMWGTPIKILDIMPTNDQ